jgi:hypothetical protein
MLDTYLATPMTLAGVHFDATVFFHHVSLAHFKKNAVLLIGTGARRLCHDCDCLRLAVGFLRRMPHHQDERRLVEVERRLSVAVVVTVVAGLGMPQRLQVLLQYVSAIWA